MNTEDLSDSCFSFLANVENFSELSLHFSDF